jgi:uncharacterized protein YecA (UPF0149 family)
VKHDTLRYLYHVQVTQRPAATQAPKVVSAQGPMGKKPQADSSGKVGRNEQCPCGSGKKYKRCHGAVA